MRIIKYVWFNLQRKMSSQQLHKVVCFELEFLLNKEDWRGCWSWGRHESRLKRGPDPPGVDLAWPEDGSGYSWPVWSAQTPRLMDCSLMDQRIQPIPEDWGCSPGHRCTRSPATWGRRWWRCSSPSSWHWTELPEMAIEIQIQHQLHLQQEDWQRYPSSSKHHKLKCLKHIYQDCSELT